MSVDTRASELLQKGVGGVGNVEGQYHGRATPKGHYFVHEESIMLVTPGTTRRRGKGSVNKERQDMAAVREGDSKYEECSNDGGIHPCYSYEEEEEEENKLNRIDKDHHLNDKTGVDMIYGIRVRDTTNQHQVSNNTQCLQKKNKWKEQSNPLLLLQHANLVKAHAIYVDMTLGIIHSMLENDMSYNDIDKWLKNEKRNGNSIVGWIKMIDVAKDEIVLSIPGTSSNEKYNCYSDNNCGGKVDVRLKLLSSAMENAQRIFDNCGSNSDNYATHDLCHRYIWDDSQNGQTNEYINKKAVDTTVFPALSRKQTPTTTDQQRFDNNNKWKEQSERFENVRLVKIHAVKVDMALSIIQSMVINGMQDDQIGHWVEREKTRGNSIVGLIEMVDVGNNKIMLSLADVLSNDNDNVHSDDDYEERKVVTLPLFSKARDTIDLWATVIKNVDKNPAQQEFQQQNFYSEQIVPDEEEGCHVSDGGKQSRVEKVGEPYASATASMALELCNVCFAKKGKRQRFIQCAGCKITVHPRCYFEEEWVHQCSSFLCDVCHAIKMRKEMYSLNMHQQQHLDHRILTPLHGNTRSNASVVSVYPTNVELSGLELRCVLCLRRDVSGGLRPTSQGRWCHLTCTMSSSDIFMKDGYIQGVPEALSMNKKYIKELLLATDDKALSCDFCGLNEGLLLPCASQIEKGENPCSIVQHPLCAELSNCARVTKRVGRVSTISFECSWHTFGTDSCCKICRRASEPNKMLLCDMCNVGFHLDCLSPPLDDVPVGDWFCFYCKMGVTASYTYDSSNPSDKNGRSTLSLRNPTREQFFPSKKPFRDAKMKANRFPSLPPKGASFATTSPYERFKLIVDNEIVPQLEKRGWRVTTIGRLKRCRHYKHPDIVGRLRGRLSLIKALVGSYSSYASNGLLAQQVSKAWKCLSFYPKLVSGEARLDRSKTIKDVFFSERRQHTINEASVVQNIRMKKRKHNDDSSTQTAFKDELIRKSDDFGGFQQIQRTDARAPPLNVGTSGGTRKSKQQLLNGLRGMRKTDESLHLSIMTKRKRKAPLQKNPNKMTKRSASSNAPYNRGVYDESWSISDNDHSLDFAPNDNYLEQRKLVNGAYVKTTIMSSFRPQHGNTQCFLSFWAGDRLLTQEFSINDKNVQPQRQFIDNDGTTYSLVSTKLTDKKGKFGSGRVFRCMYFAISGPSFGKKKSTLQRELEKIADFASLAPEKIVARLELFQTPCPKNRLFTNLNVDMFEMIEEDSHMGCGFIPECILERLLKRRSVALRTVAIQVRIISPALGIFKGVLVRKLGIDKIELPSSMLKVNPSIRNIKGEEGRGRGGGKGVVMVTRGLFPSRTNAYLGQFWDPDLDDPPQSFKERNSSRISPMISRIMKGLGVKEAMLEKYYKHCRDIGAQHGFLAGVCDPTTKLPQGTIFIPGFDKDERGHRKLLAQGHDDIFVTRCPCVEASDAKMLRVVSMKPKRMEQHAWDWLCNLSFGVIVFGTPKNEKVRPLPETIAGGDLDGDLYFVCWNEEILQPLKQKDVKVKMLKETEEKGTRRMNTAKTGSNPYDNGRLSNKTKWLQLAQDRMLDFEYQNDISRLTGQLCRLNELTAGESEDGILDKDAIAFGKAYKMALDIFKHGGKVYLPRHLHEEIKPERLRKFLSA